MFPILVTFERKLSFFFFLLQTFWQRLVSTRRYFTPPPKLGRPWIRNRLVIIYFKILLFAVFYHWHIYTSFSKLVQLLANSYDHWQTFFLILAHFLLLIQHLAHIRNLSQHFLNFYQNFIIFLHSYQIFSNFLSF